MAKLYMLKLFEYKIDNNKWNTLIYIDITLSCDDSWQRQIFIVLSIIINTYHGLI